MTPQGTAKPELWCARPTSSEELSAAVASREIDLITFDSQSSIAEDCERYIEHATAKGILIEICCGNMFKGGTAQVGMMRVARSLVRATAGRGLVLSSGPNAEDYIQRAPYDLMYL